MNIEIDKETIEMINDFETLMGDDSYAIHLAHKILELYKEQFGE